MIAHCLSHSMAAISITIITSFQFWDLVKFITLFYQDNCSTLCICERWIQTTARDSYTALFTPSDINNCGANPYSKIHDFILITIIQNTISLPELKPLMRHISTKFSTIHKILAIVLLWMYSTHSSVTMHRYVTKLLYILANKLYVLNSSST